MADETFIITMVVAGVIFAATTRSLSRSIRRYPHGQGVAFVPPILKKAKTAINIRAGELNADFWSNNEVLAAVEEGTKSAEMRILFGPHIDVRNIDFFEWALAKKNVTFKHLKLREMPHFQTVDDTFVNLESAHEPFQPRVGLVGRHKKLAAKLNRLFEEDWARAEEFDLHVALEKVIGRNEKNDAESDSFSLVTPTGAGESIADKAQVERVAALV